MQKGIKPKGIIYPKTLSVIKMSPSMETLL